MGNKPKSDFLLPPAFLGVLIVAYFAVWSFLYGQIYLNTDLGWLLLCLERFLDGGSYTSDFYETNPPLSFLIYLPAYPLYTFVGISPAFAIHLLFFGYMAISGLVIFKYLRNLGYPDTMITALLTFFLFAQTWMLGTSFGQKDQLIFLCLIPFILMQVSAYAKKDIDNPLGYFSAFLGALAVCLKPHYIMVAAVFYLTRLYKNRSLPELLKAKDVWIFIGTGLAYLIFLRLVFPDYVDVILPETVDFYAEQQPFPIHIQLYFLVYAFIAFLISMFSGDTEQTKFLRVTTYAFIGLSLLFALPYAAQNKGFFYHAIPLVSTSVMGLMLSIFGLIYYTSRKIDIAIILPFAIVLFMFKGYMHGTGDGYLTHEEFRTLPFHQKLENYASNNVYMNLKMKPFNLALPHYSELENGSRFGQIWPIFGLNDKFAKVRTEKEREEIRAKIQTYIDMIAEDIERSKPGVIAIPQYEDPQTKEMTNSYFKLLSKNENFAEAFNDYKFAETFTFDEHIYERGSKKPDDKNTVRPYDLFVRPQSAEPSDQ